MNKGLFQAIIQFESEGNLICEKLTQKNILDNGSLEVISLFKNVLGNGFLLINELDEALQYYNQCLTVRKQLGNESFIADSLLNIGLVYFNRGNLKQANEYESEALELYKQANDTFGILNTSVNLIILKMNQSKWNEATELIKEAMTLAKSHKSIKFASVLLQMQGDIHENKGNLDEALKYYNKSLELKRQLGNEKMVADGLVSIGHVHIEKKEYLFALDHFKKSIEYYTASVSMLHIISSTFWIFWVYYTLENKKEIDFYETQLEQLTKFNSDKRTLQILTITNCLHNSLINNSIVDDNHAATIQNLLGKNDIVDIKLQIIAMNILCMYKLHKLRTEATPNFELEINQLIEDMYKLGTEKKSYKFMINSLVLKAKYNLILGNIEDSLTTIKSAYELAEKHELIRLLDEIKKEEKELDEKIEIWYKEVPINPPIAEKIDTSNILDYLKDIMYML